MCFLEILRDHVFNCSRAHWHAELRDEQSGLVDLRPHLAVGCNRLARLVVERHTLDLAALAPAIGAPCVLGILALPPGSSTSAMVRWVDLLTLSRQTLKRTFENRNY